MQQVEGNLAPTPTMLPLAAETIDFSRHLPLVLPEEMRPVVEAEVAECREGMKQVFLSMRVVTSRDEIDKSFEGSDKRREAAEAFRYFSYKLTISTLLLTVDGGIVDKEEAADACSNPNSSFSQRTFEKVWAELRSHTRQKKKSA